MTEPKQQPHRPPIRTANRYRHIAHEMTKSKPKPVEPQDLFTMTISRAPKPELDSAENNTIGKGELMDEEQFLINLVFKPVDPKLKLRPEENQLILAHINEILRQYQDEEESAIENEKAGKNPGE